MKGTDKQDEQKQRADEQESEQNSTAQVREQQQQEHRKRHGTNVGKWHDRTHEGTRRVRQQYPATLPQPNPYPIYQGYAYPYDSEYMEHQQHQQQWGIAAVGNPYW